MKESPEKGLETKSSDSAGQKFICVNCGMIMIQRHCKVRCPRCGYFEDCSDGGNDQTNVVFQ